jgi:hypothetical protein
MRSAFAVTTPLVLLLGMGVADAADPTQLAETGGFLLGNASRCGVSAERVESAGKVIHDFIAAAARSERSPRPRPRRLPVLHCGDPAIRQARATPRDPKESRNPSDQPGLLRPEIIEPVIK